ncbi:MAG: hypothetical protein R3242_00090 [Akkermansiaceae bacterium]|nr:hypothetical protein [Akkermansiaceae bacterium]
MADPHFSVREKATHELWKLGNAALPKLRKLADSEDPEQATRARELVRKIEMGVFPDSDPELLAIVERYSEARPSEKSKLLAELQSRKAWKQMLMLYQGETHEGVRRHHQSTLQRIAVYAARELLTREKPEEALEMLELAPDGPLSMLALAEFHRTHGTLDAELEKASKLEGDRAAQWRIALYRAAGKVEQALAETDADKQPFLHAGLAALNGDPLPWLQLRASNWEEEDRRSRNHTLSIYARLASDRWNSNSMDFSDLDKLVSIQEKRSSRYRHMARSALFMLGEHRTAEQSLVKDAPIKAAFYYQIQEEVDKVLELLAHTPQKPCTKEWVSLQFDNLGEDGFRDLEDSKQALSLCLMAGFLENRGLHDLALECFREPTIAFGDKDRAAFLDFMMRLYHQSGSYLPSPLLATRIASDWAGEDDKRWSLLIDTFWSGDDDSHEWWKLLAELDPETTRAERLESVMVILRHVPNQGRQRQRWLDLAWKHYQDLEEGQEKQSVLMRLINLAFNTGDVELSRKVWPLIPEDYSSNYIWRQQIAHLSARDDWDAVSELLVERIDEVEQGEGGSVHAEIHAYAATSMRRAGRLEEARHHDHMADLLCLGDSRKAMQIAMAYAFGGDHARSREWWERAALTADPGSSDFSAITLAYAESILMEPSHWRRVAALNELAACESIENSYYENDVPYAEMKLRLKADVYRALSILKKDRKTAIAILAKCHENHMTDGVLADFFFPVLRVAGLQEQHNQWFDASWEKLTRVIELFPDSANTCNAAGWFASRAQRELKAAEGIQKRALELSPDQAAYLDTMAEIHFAKGNREEALRWSNKAIFHAPVDTELRRQYHHFANDPLPRP